MGFIQTKISLFVASVTFGLFLSRKVYCPNGISTCRLVTFCLPKKGLKREFESQPCEMAKKALCPKLPRAEPTPTSLGKEAYAPTQPLAIEVTHVDFVTKLACATHIAWVES